MSEFNGAAMSSKVSALVEAARALDRPTESDRTRVHARLTAALAASAPVSGAEQPQASAANGGSSVPVSVVAFAGQALLVMVLSAALTSAVIWSHQPRASHHARSSRAAPVVPALVVAEAPAPASELAAASGEAPQPPRAELAAASGETAQPPRHPTRPTRPKKPTVHAEPAAEPEPDAPPPPAAKPIGPPPPTALAGSVPTPASGLGGELALLVAAQQALAANALERALALLDQHAARYPTGSLLPERLAARAATLCRLQRREEGARTLRELRLRAPSSPLLSWANGQCQREAR